MRILYIDIDALRPDHLGCYGYHRNTSPTIDQIAKEGIVLDRAYTSDAPCMPSRTAFYSGRFGIQTGAVAHGGTAAEPKSEGPNRSFRDIFDDQGLARQLQKLGYHTAMVSPFGQRHAAWHFYAGFNEIHNTGEGGMEPAEIIQPVVDKWMQDNAEKDNWYLHINYWDAHTPYRAPEAYGDPFTSDPLPAWLEDDKLISKHNKMVGPHSSLDINTYNDEEDPNYPRQPGKVDDQASMRKMIDGYDIGVRYVDDQIAKIIEQLKQAGVYEDTMIIISADHGENLGELGIYGEHSTADNITCRIPMIIKYPGGPQGIRNRQFHYNVDWAPTLMELLGGEMQPCWDGASFAPVITQGLEVGRDEVIVSQCSHTCQRSVLWDRWLYIRTYHDGFHLFPKEMLFDLQDDPHETINLAESHKELCREGLWKLNEWHDQQMEKMALYGTDVIDPLWTVMKEGGPFYASLTKGQPGLLGFKNYLEHLENTGRHAGAEALRTRHAERIKVFSEQ